MQKHYELSKAAVEKKKIRENLRPVIAQAMQKATGMEDFKRLIRGKGIGVVFRENETGRIYGVTFIDYQNRTILNGSRLGKEFSANVFNEFSKQNHYYPVKKFGKPKSLPKMVIFAFTTKRGITMSKSTNFTR